MTDDEINSFYEDLARIENDIIDHNNQIIDSFGKNAQRDFEILLGSCDVVNKITYVDAPSGKPQHGNAGMFKNIHVEQWSQGLSGDLYVGYIYAFVKGKWIKVPYSC